MYQLGLISDVHARPEPVEQALNIFAQEQVDEIICAGDIAGYYEDLEATIKLIQQAKCKTVLGNHDQTYLDTAKSHSPTIEDYLKSLPLYQELECEGKSIFLVHAAPPDLLQGGIKLLDQHGKIIASQKKHWASQLQDFEYDILIVGHTHQVYAEKIANSLVINPGSTAFNHSCMILKLPEMTLQTYALEDQPIIKSWNFSMLYGSHSQYPSARKS
ncbi:MAG: metallophosphoesterase family protein [Gammaproteobacteria bacterium]|nr:metallophosphoesterase family protein [Gammaproteobacteria bacterium]